ncbi:ROK family transcriptional regulator [Sneathia sanguinegens]|uniref:ROK family transcriptional regulator n=1 Tax=Sneathia sanguinegens TaxID=40543 RepID=UPI0023F7F862|nr:ROK family transcriptional regulator [Sneathia sanguinegens]
MRKLRKSEFRLLNIIFKEKEISSCELQKKLKITGAAISRTLKKLEEVGYIKQVHEKRLNKKGRPRKIVKINEDFKKVIGVTLGLGFLSISVANLEGKILENKRKKFFIKKNKSLIDLLLEEMSKIISKYSKNEIIGIGVAIHGIVDPFKKEIILSPFFKWKNLKLGDLLEEKFDIPVILENNVNAMLNAENLFGRSKNMENCLYIYMNNGVGGALKINNSIYRGSRLQAGEIGHYIIDENSNCVCNCGKVGCLQFEFSAENIKLLIANEIEKKFMNKYNIDKYEMKQIYAVTKKYPLLKKIIERLAMRMGEYIGNLLQVIDIDNVIIAGDIIYTKNIFIDSFQKGIDKNLIKEIQDEKINVYYTELKDKIEDISSVSLILKKLFEYDDLISI